LDIESAYMYIEASDGQEKVGKGQYDQQTSDRHKRKISKCIDIDFGDRLKTWFVIRHLLIIRLRSCDLIQGRNQ